jgi:hypothetical protein
MLCGSCASAIGAIEGVFKPAMLIIAAANAKIVGLIPIFSLILIVGLIAVAALIFTPRKIAGICFFPSAGHDKGVEAGTKCRTNPLCRSPIVDSFEERKVTDFLVAQNKAAHLFREAEVRGLIGAGIAES